MQQGLDEAKTYLAESSALRRALGIAPDAPLEPMPLGQGEHNANFWFSHPDSERRVVLRLNYASQLGLADQASYEFSALRELKPSGRTPAPLFLDDSKSIIGRGVIAMEFCEGGHLDYKREGDVREAAAMLADVHAVRPSASCRLLRPTDPLRAQFDEDVRLLSAYRSSAIAEERVVRRVERMLARAARSLDTPFDSADACHILNTEAIAAHFLIPQNGGRGRMVDWEKPIVGEVAQDVAYFLSPTTTIWDVDFLFPIADRKRFVEAYWEAVDGRFPRGGFDARFEAYTMTNCLRGITWSAAALVDYADPNRPLKNEKTSAVLGRYVSEEFLDYVEESFFSE